MHFQQVEGSKLTPLLQTYVRLALVDLGFRPQQFKDLWRKLLPENPLWVNAPELSLNLEQLGIILILEQRDIIPLVPQVVYHMFKDVTFPVKVDPIIDHLKVLPPGEEFGHETVFNGCQHRLAHRDLVRPTNI